MPPPEKTVIATVGLPRSGKSTWAREQTYPIVCPDEIRLALHGQVFSSIAEPFVWAICKVMVRALFGAGHDTVILDATNTTEQRRNEWVSALEWNLKFYLITTPLETCIQRAIECDRLELIPVITRMAAQFEPVQYGDLLN